MDVCGRVYKVARERLLPGRRVMYFPTSVATQLCNAPALANPLEEPVLDITPSARKSLFCALTASSIQLWRVRVRVEHPYHKITGLYILCVEAACASGSS